MQFGLILAAIGIFVGAAKAQLPNMASELRGIKNQNNALRDQINKLQLSLAANHYNNERINSMKENISVLKLKCSNHCDESVGPLNATVIELESTVKVYKKLIAKGVGLPTNPLENQLRHCQAQLAQLWTASA